MAAFTTRAARAVAATTTALVTTALLAGATPAHALDHYIVDQDSVALTETAAKFDGGLEGFHDGNRLQARLSGALQSVRSTWCVRISTQFIYYDGSESPAWLDS